MLIRVSTGPACAQAANGSKAGLRFRKSVRKLRMVRMAAFVSSCGLVS